MIHRALVLAPRLTLKGEGQLSSAQVARLARTLRELAAAGVTEACVMDGAKAEQLGLALGTIAGLELSVRGHRSWRQAGGSALRHARDFLSARPGPCLVVRGDRPIDRQSLRMLCAATPPVGGAVLLVARPPSLSEAHRGGLVDVAKVCLNAAGDRVVDLDPDLATFDGLSTGHVAICPTVVDGFRHLNNPTLEDALAHLIPAGALHARVGGLVWPCGPQEIEVCDQVAAILDSKSHPRYTLLNPGPVNTTARVKSALVHHDVCHRDDSFSELLVGLTSKLRRIFRGGPAHSVCLLTGSGTAAMECALSSSVEPGKKILIVENGAFGERLREIASVHQLDVVHLSYPWGEGVDPADVAAALDANPDISVVAMIHHETSVGILNPVREVGRLTRERDVLFVVDAVSSLGAERLDVVRDGIDICYASANKCLHAVSGVGFLCVDPRVWKRIEAIRPRSYYLDLRRYRRYGEELAQTPFTPAVSAYFALDAACAEFLADGHERRWATYRDRNQRLRRGLAELGMASFTETGHESHSVVTCRAPDGVDVRDLYDRLRDRGYIVYGCKGILADKFLQVANMGDLEDGQLARFLAVIGDVLVELSAAASTDGTEQIASA